MIFEIICELKILKFNFEIQNLACCAAKSSPGGMGIRKGTARPANLRVLNVASNCAEKPSYRPHCLEKGEGKNEKTFVNEKFFLQGFWSRFRGGKKRTDLLVDFFLGRGDSEHGGVQAPLLGLDAAGQAIGVLRLTSRHDLYMCA